ncbi:MAG: hypothetical protein AAGB51_07705 [Planctomycetota bacterium]
MSKAVTDPAEVIRTTARTLDDVCEGTACSQTSFKAMGKAFLYIGEQGGRSKAMFRLRDSLGKAEEMAAVAPDDFQIGNQGWVTARFDAAKPLSTRIWKRWLKESYSLAVG